MITRLPSIVAPINRTMATEPALEIGERYTHKDTGTIVVVTLVGVLVALSATLVLAVSPFIQIMVHIGVPIVMGAYTKWQLIQNAKDQAVETREAVYSPATVARIVTQVERKVA